MTPEIPDAVKQQFQKADWRKIALIEWNVEDWTDWYHCISFALFKIHRRHSKDVTAQEIDFQI